MYKIILLGLLLILTAASDALAVAESVHDHVVIRCATGDRASKPTGLTTTVVHEDTYSGIKLNWDPPGTAVEADRNIHAYEIWRRQQGSSEMTKYATLRVILKTGGEDWQSDAFYGQCGKWSDKGVQPPPGFPDETCHVTTHITYGCHASGGGQFLDTLNLWDSSSTEFIDLNVEHNVQYFYRLVARTVHAKYPTSNHFSEKSSPTNGTFVQRQPGTPTNLSAALDSDGFPTLNWTEPAITSTNPKPQGYQFRRRVGDGGTWTVLPAEADIDWNGDSIKATTRIDDDNNLAVNTGYQYQVRAARIHHPKWWESTLVLQAGPWSSTVNITTGSSFTRRSKARAAPEQRPAESLKLPARELPEGSVVISANKTQLDLNEIVTLSATISNEPEGMSPVYQWEYHDNGGWLILPVASSPELTFTEGQDNLNIFRIVVEYGGEWYAVSDHIVVTWGNPTHQTVTIDEDGNITVTAPDYVAPEAAGRVTGLEASVTDDSVLLEWDAPGDGGPVIGYEVARRVSEKGSFLKLLETISGSETTTYTDSSVEPGKRYIYRVAAVGGGRGPTSGPVSISVPETQSASEPPPGVPPTVKSVSIISDTGPDDTYGKGDDINVQVTFSEPVDVTGTPRLKIDMSPGNWGEKWATYESGSGTRDLVFMHKVVWPNESTQGVAVLGNKLELNGGTIDSASTGRASTLDHDGLPHDPNHRVDWRPVLTVADVSANESEPAVEFVVNLSRPVPHTVRVDYSTADTSATAGGDYTAVSGTLVFNRNEQTKQISVPILDDVVDEGAETFLLGLTNARGARLGDRSAIGTIANSDPLQKMWLSRFGRSVASQMTDAVSDRLERSPEAQVTVGGYRVDLANLMDERVAASLTRSLLSTEDKENLLFRSRFHISDPKDSSGLTAWGQVTRDSFDGRASSGTGTASIDGRVTSIILGADAAWSNWVVGLVTGFSDGSGVFSQPEVESGSVESKLVTVSPYVKVDWNAYVSTWGMLGVGYGDMRITQDANDRGQIERTAESDVRMRLGALGGRKLIFQSGREAGLAMKADAFFVKMDESSRVNTEVGVGRVRLALEGNKVFRIEGNSMNTDLEIALRYDGGDAERGVGVEASGSLRWDTVYGLSVGTKARMLVTHEDTDYEEWGISGVVKFAQNSGRGLSLSLTPMWGNSTSDAENLWSAQNAGSLAREFEPRTSLKSEIGYGVLAFGGDFLATPYTGLNVAQDETDLFLGWRLLSVRRGDMSLRLEAKRREANENIDHQVNLDVGISW